MRHLLCLAGTEDSHGTEVKTKADVEQMLEVLQNSPGEGKMAS